MREAYEIAINRFAEIFKTHFSWKWIAAIAGVMIFYFVDVWALGTTAASIYDFNIWSKGIKIFATPEQKAAAAAHIKLWPWFFSHPFSVGWAWLTKPTETLSHPEVKYIWMFVNIPLLTFHLEAGASKGTQQELPNSSTTAYNREKLRVLHGLQRH